ncbi:Cytochrome c oxidase subunit VIb [Trinorchestia longiramus]|nr:Cytochrome c oxidase subunit VIb [Trinorchestia longiramus]
MSFRDKQSRNLCYASRDRYWECLDAVPIATEGSLTSAACRNDVTRDVKGQCDSQSAAGKRETRSSRSPATHQAKYGARLQANAEQTGTLKPCMELRRLCQASCPEHWMKHFDRKRQYMLFRAKVAAVGRMDSTSDLPAKNHENIQTEGTQMDNSSENNDQTFLEIDHSVTELRSTSPSSDNQNEETVTLRNKGRCANGFSTNRYSVGSCLPNINIIPAASDRTMAKDSGILSSNFRLSLNFEDSDSRPYVPNSASCSLVDTSTPNLAPGYALSRTASDSYLKNILGHPSTSESNSTTRISRSSNELGGGSESLDQRSLTDRMMLAFQFPHSSSSRSPSSSLSPYSSLVSSPTSSDLAPPIAPARKRRVYSQVVFRQRLVPTN